MTITQICSYDYFNHILVFNRTNYFSQYTLINNQFLFSYHRNNNFRMNVHEINLLQMKVGLLHINKPVFTRPFTRNNAFAREMQLINIRIIFMFYFLISHYWTLVNIPEYSLLNAYKIIGTEMCAIVKITEHLLFIFSQWQISISARNQI